MRHALILVLVAACGGGAAKSSATMPPPAKGPSCAGTADGMVGMMVASMTPKPPDTDADGLRGLIRERCEKDHWSPEAQRCLSDMKTADDANVCSTLLTDDQQAALVKAQQAKYGAGPPAGASDGAAPKDAGKPATRGPKPKDSKGSKDSKGDHDPCDGGE
jgi:hypothetical protein